MNIYGVRPSFIVVPTGTDVAGTSSILSLVHSSSPPLFLCPSFSLALTRWRDAPFQTFFAHRSSLLSHPPLFLLFPSLSIQKHPRSLVPSFLSPPDKGRQRPFFSPLACLHSLCLYCTKQGSLSHCIPSFFLQKKVSRGPGAPASGLRGRASAPRESILFHLALWCSAGIVEENLWSCVCDKDTTSPQPGNSIQGSRGCVRALSHPRWLPR